MNRRRKLIDRTLIGLCLFAVALAVIPLVSIIFDVVSQGASAISISFLTGLPRPPDIPGGGVSNAIEGTLILIALGSLLGIPVGILSGVYVSEYGGNWYGGTIGFLGDVLAGIPSIVVGVVVYALIVLEFHHYSAIAGGLALGLVMIPIASNTTTAALRAVPNSVREASLALGARSWRKSIVVLANAKNGIATGVLLSIARITGETAPLILTALSSTLPFSGLGQPVNSLTVQIFEYATSPFKTWQTQAWGAALLLLLIVLGINIGVRLLVARGGSSR